MNCIRYFSSSDPTSVIEATCEAHEPKSVPADYVKNVDRRMEVKLELGDVKATGRCDFGMPNVFGFIPRFPQIRLTVQGDKGSLEMFNFVLPTVYHSITVKTQGGHTRVERVYKAKEGKGEEWWTTWRFQLEAMVDRVRGRETNVWITKEDTITNMEWIEKVYEKVFHSCRVSLVFMVLRALLQSGLGRRPRADPVVDALNQGK